MLDKAFEALQTYDWGNDQDHNALKAIDQAIVATHGDAEARTILETRLVSALVIDEPDGAAVGDVARRVNDFVCRKLNVIGTARSVPTLAKLLPNEKYSHMARYALVGIPAPEAVQALRDALPDLPNELKIGAISSLGRRQDAASVAPLGALLDDSDPAVARAAALALGAIRSAAAAKVLSSAKPNVATKSAVTDALLACAESLLASGKKGAALAIYKTVARGDQPKHVKLAATRGLLTGAR